MQISKTKKVVLLMVFVLTGLLTAFLYEMSLFRALYDVAYEMPTGVELEEVRQRQQESGLNVDVRVMDVSLGEHYENEMVTVLTAKLRTGLGGSRRNFVFTDGVHTSFGCTNQITTL